MKQAELTLATARSELRTAIDLHRQTGEALERASMSFEAALKVGSDAIEDCADSPPCAHRRAHRPVRPSKIDGDPELRAFILARIDRITFIDLAEAIRASFPPGRRVQKTALNDWWQKHLSERQ